MKATVHYDKNGTIHSVTVLGPRAASTPRSAHHETLEIELDDTSPQRIIEIHNKHRVDTTHRRLVRT